MPRAKPPYPCEFRRQMVELAGWPHTGTAVARVRTAAADETDARRYGQLRTQAVALDETGLRAALAKARESDAPEVESLRAVAFNDVVLEVGRGDHLMPLTPHQRLLAALA